MSEAVVKLGWDNSGARAGAQEALGIAQSLKAKTEKVLAKTGNVGGIQKGGMGMLAMQTQDIAIQAQMGTNALQIFAQQGSQIASIFGESGAVVGGIAAVAGALVYAGQKGNEAFAELTSSSQTFGNELGKVAASGSITQMADMLGAMEEKSATLRAETDALGSSFMSLAKGVMGTFTGGASMDERRAQLTQAMASMEQTRATVLKQVVDLSEQELQIQLAKVKGNDELAADLERQFNLEKKILGIRQMPLPTEEQDILIGNAKKLAKAEEAAAAAAKNAEAAKRRTAGLTQLNEARRAVDTFDESDEKKLLRLNGERVKLQQELKDARGDEVKQIEVATSLARTELSILETKKAIATATAAEMKKQADAAMVAFNAEADRQATAAAAEAQTAKTASQARADAEKQLEIMRLRASGETAAADAAAKELGIRQEARRIAEEQNISYKSALQQAKELADLQERANGAGREPGSIQGYSQDRQGNADDARARAQKRMDEARERIEQSRVRSFGGLREFERLQQRNGNGERVLPMGRASAAAEGNKQDLATPLLSEMKQLMARSAAALETLSAA